MSFVPEIVNPVPAPVSIILCPKQSKVLLSAEIVNPPAAKSEVNVMYGQNTSASLVLQAVIESQLQLQFTVVLYVMFPMHPFVSVWFMLLFCHPPMHGEVLYQLPLTRFWWQLPSQL